MPVQVQESVQVDFLLQVRKADLGLMSMRQVDILMKDMDSVLKLIIDRGYLVEPRVTFVGVMT